MMTVVAVLVLAGCSSGTDYDAFRAEFADRLTGDATFGDAPELSDEQIDEAIGRVCAGGEPDLDEADAIGEALAGDEWSPSGMGSAIYQAVRVIGCA